MIKKLLLVTALVAAVPFISSAQDEEEDPSKMIREIVNVEMERPKTVATPPPPPPPAEEHHKGKKGKKHHEEEPPPPAEEAMPDTLSATVPATIAELNKRANYWYTTKNKKFTKDGGGGSGAQVICTVKFSFKPRELNPANDVEGEITMQVTIDCKEGKYRYTIDKLVHKAKRGLSSGGNVFNEIPGCGTVNIDPSLWNQIKSAAFVDAKIVVDDLKAKMAVPVPTKGKNDW